MKNGKFFSRLLAFLLVLVLLFSLIPIFIAVAALFTDSSKLSDGIDLFALNQFAPSNLIEKINYIRDDPALLASFLRTLTISVTVGAVCSFSALTLAFVLTRVSFGLFDVFKPLVFFAYLTPPVILVLSFGWLATLADNAISSLMIVAIGQSAFLFPLNYGLAVGHWLQTEAAIDRNSSIDGASIWRRFAIHLTPGSGSFGFGCGLALLSFMLSWSDIIFSRFLLVNNRDSRLLTDLALDILAQNDVMEPRGELALIAFLTVLVAGVSALTYATLLSRNLRQE